MNNVARALFDDLPTPKAEAVRTAEDIVAEALRHKPRKIFVGFSGGNDSLATVTWMMRHVEDVEVFHANMVRIVCPATADRLKRLEDEVKAEGHDWGWEDKPPSAAQKFTAKHQLVMPFCNGCGKAA